MHRLFVAIRPPLLLRTALSDAMPDIDGARWQDDAQLHVTLRFIGAVERPVAEDIAVVLGDIRTPAFDLVLGAPGRFDRRGRLDSLWIGAGPADRLTALHHKVDRVLVRLGLPSEQRSYVPHVTLARFGRIAGDPTAFLSAPALGLSAPVTAFVLYESRLAADGALYEPIARYPLGAR